MPEGKCFFCVHKCEIYTVPFRHSVKEYRCQFCGPYLLNDVIVAMYSSHFSAPNKFKLTCILKERRLRGQTGIAFSEKTDYEAIIHGYPQISLDDVLKTFPTKANDIINRVLLNLSKLPTPPFEAITLNMDNISDCAILYTSDKKSCDAILREIANQGLIRFNEVKAGLQFNVFYRTTEFWDKVELLESNNNIRTEDRPDSSISIGTRQNDGDSECQYDIFISHASEDKDPIVRPLADGLSTAGLRIWYDDFELTIGDSLRQSIDQGLAKSRYGLVVLSRSFFDKRWPQYELDGLVDRQMSGRKVILPIWHEITHDELSSYSPSLAGTVALDTNKSSIDEIVKEITRVVSIETS